MRIIRTLLKDLTFFSVSLKVGLVGISKSLFFKSPLANLAIIKGGKVENNTVSMRIHAFQTPISKDGMRDTILYL